MSAIPTAHVPAGEYRIGSPGRGRLEAYLGSCVGVAIVDRRARVGGLLHALLAEPVSRDRRYSATFAARTAVPIFLEALEAAGCTRGGMQATLAGGALFGRLSQMDFDLDLGGRTVEVVNELLRQAGVPVIASETGGLLATRLRLDLDTLSSVAEPVVSFPAGPVRTPTPPTDGELDRAISRLKPVPQAALKIVRMLHGDDYGLRDIALEVRRDQVLSARVIQACNAAHLGAVEPILDIDQALLVLGGRVVGALIVSRAMRSFFTGSSHGYSTSRGGLYHHAVSTAIVAEQLATSTRASDRGVAYTAGLLHDIGKVVLDQHVADARPFFYREVEAGGRELLETERSALGVSHEEAGARLARAWEFPAVLQEAIGRHTDPTGVTTEPPLAHLVHLADLLVTRFDAGHEIDRIGTHALDETLARLRVTRQDLPALLAGIRWSDLWAPGYLG